MTSGQMSYYGIKAMTERTKIDEEDNQRPDMILRKLYYPNTAEETSQ